MTPGEKLETPHARGSAAPPGLEIPESHPRMVLAGQAARRLLRQRASAVTREDCPERTAAELKALTAVMSVLYASQLPTETLLTLSASSVGIDIQLGTLISIRLVGGRSFLHTSTPHSTLAEQRGRYAMAQLLTESIQTWILDQFNLPAECRLYSTINDSVLLTTPEQAAQCPSLLATVEDGLSSIHPSLGIEVVCEPVYVRDFMEQRLGQRLMGVNRRATPKSEARVGFSTAPFESADLVRYLQHLGRHIDRYPHMIRCNHMKATGLGAHVGACLPVWYYGPSDVPPAAGVRVPTSELIATVGLPENHRLLNSPLKELLFTGGDETLSLARLDGEGLLQQLATEADVGLIEFLQLSSRITNFFLTTVPEIVRRFNSHSGDTDQVLLLHSSSDDIVIAGPHRCLAELSEEIVSNFAARTGGSMVYGVGLGRPGMVATELSRAALQSLIERKAALRTRC